MLNVCHGSFSLHTHARTHTHAHAAVGKTSLITRFMYDSFDNTYQVSREREGGRERERGREGEREREGGREREREGGREGERERAELLVKRLNRNLAKCSKY